MRDYDTILSNIRLPMVLYRVRFYESTIMVHTDEDNFVSLTIFVGWGMCTVWPAGGECHYYYFQILSLDKYSRYDICILIPNFDLKSGLDPLHKVVYD